MSQPFIVKEGIYPYHDLIVFKDRESMEQNLWNRYEPGDTKCTRLSYTGTYRYACIYKMNEEREWDMCLANCSIDLYFSLCISVKIFLEPPDFTLVTHLKQHVDYVFPTENTVYFCRSRTEKLRRKRAKPASLKEEEIYQEE